MAKTAGSVRVSKWENDIYHEGGKRKEYSELSADKQGVIRARLKVLQNAMYAKLSDKTVKLRTDNSEIVVGFTKKGTDHVARDLMLTLSGKYMSEKSMMNIDTILAQSAYVPTSHKLYKNRKDGIEHFFRYKDKTGREVYFKVAYHSKRRDNKTYYLYSVTDK